MQTIEFFSRGMDLASLPNIIVASKKGVGVSTREEGMVANRVSIRTIEHSNETSDVFTLIAVCYIMEAHFAWVKHYLTW